MIIQLGRILIHDLLRLVHRVSPSERFDTISWSLVLFFRMLVIPKILDLAGSSGTLVDLEAGGEFLVRAYLNGVEKVDSEVLAVVADQVVSWTLVAHVVDDHFTWKVVLVECMGSMGKWGAYWLVEGLHR